MQILDFLFGSKVQKHRRSVAPVDYIFLRNYKKIHRSRLQQTIATMQGQETIKIVDAAYDENGNELPLKLAVYAVNNDSASLFFQFYQRIKTEEKNKGLVNIHSR